MIIKKIILNNIRSYKNEEIEFPDGIFLLSGDIGSGKSSLLLAIEFGLFGIQKGITEGSDLLRDGEDCGFIELFLEIKEKKIKIRRGLKRHKRGISQEDTSIEIDGKRERLSTTELKHFILQLLNYPLSLINQKNLVYRFTVYTPQGEMHAILSAKREARVDILRKVFGIDKYKKIKNSSKFFLESLREKIKLKEGSIQDLKFKQEQAETKEEKLKKSKSEITELEPSLKEKRKKMGEFKKSIEDIEEVIKKINSLNQERAFISSLIKEKEKSSELQKKDVLELKEKVSLLEEKLKGKRLVEEEILEKKIEELKKNLQIKKEKLNEIERLIASSNALKERYKADVDKLMKFNSCPTCKREIDLGYKNKINLEFKEFALKESEKIKKKNEEKEKNLEEIKKIEEKINNLIEEKHKLEIIKRDFEELKQNKMKIEESKKIIDETENIILKNKEKLNEISDFIRKNKNIEEKFAKTKEELMSLIEKEREFSIKYASFESEIRAFVEEINYLKKEIEKKLKQKKKMEILTDLKEWIEKKFIILIEEIEKKVMIRLNLEFNELFKGWFSKLVNNEAIDASIDIDFTPMIVRNGYDSNYESLSGGEKTALALAYRLALNQVINSTLSNLATKDLLILDEPTDGFSEQQLDRVGEILSDLKVKQLIVVSHKPKIEGFVNKIIKIKKENHLSKVLLP